MDFTPIFTDEFRWFWIIVFFVLGTGIGSFLNVVIYRVPEGMSIVLPASHCPSCNKAIKAWENIPVLSYLMLGGKCSNCKVHISIQYPIVEAVTGAFYAFLFFWFGWSVEFPIYLVMVSHLIALSVIDIKIFRLPNPIVLSGLIFGVLLNLVLRPEFWMQMLLGGVAGAGFLFGIGLIGDFIMKKETMGMGDVKLAGMIGLTVGLWHTLGMFAIGFIIAALVGVIFMVSKSKGFGNKIPFGPYLALGVFVSLIRGVELWRFYLSLVLR